MGKNRNYTNYSKGPNKPVESVENIENNEVVESVEVEIEQESKIEETEPVIGVVENCVRLNVRERPHATAMVLGIVDVTTELVIIEEESTDEFYKICTSAGLEGYCMKQYVTIMP